MDLHARARELGQAIRETPEFRAVQAAKERIDEHEAARIMLADFRRREAEYRRAVLSGKATEEQAKEIKDLAEIVTCNPYIRDLFAAEAALAQLVVGVQNEILAAAGMAEESGGTEGREGGNG